MVDAVTERKILTYIWTVENKVMWIFEDFRVVVTRTKENADPITFPSGLTNVKAQPQRANARTVPSRQDPSV